MSTCCSNLKIMRKEIISRDETPSETEVNGASQE